MIIVSVIVSVMIIVSVIVSVMIIVSVIMPMISVIVSVVIVVSVIFFASVRFFRLIQKRNFLSMLHIFSVRVSMMIVIMRMPMMIMSVAAHSL